MNGWTILLDLWPIMLALLMWAISLERRLAKIQADLCWIKEALAKAQ